MASLPTKEIEPRSGVESGTSGSRCVVRFMSASGVMRVGCTWYVGCAVRWYACIGVPPSYASFLREHLCKCIIRQHQNCADHRALQAPTNRRCYSDLHIVLHNPIFVRAIWLCCDVTFWVVLPRLSSARLPLSLAGFGNWQLRNQAEPFDNQLARVDFCSSRS